MSTENALVPFEQVKNLVISATGQIDFGADAEIVEWSEVSEAIDPRGPQVKCRDICGKPFTIQRFKPFLSNLSGTEQMVYWIVGKQDDGQYFNTVLGGQAIVEELTHIIFINQMYAQARDDGDVLAMEQWRSVGGGKRPRLTIEYHQGGQFSGYYTVARTVKNQS